jgi:CubicO group peptidase (beta-lactamase class C family)
MGSLGNPYLIQDIPDAPIYICAYKNNSLMRQAYLNALLGKTKIDGKLPVNIPEIAKIGHGITIEMKEKKSKILQPKPGQEIKQVIPYEANANTENVSFLLKKAIQNKAWPGSVLLGSKDGKIFIHEASGFHTYDKRREVRKSDIFDLASITKVISTTSAIMKLYDNKLLDLDDPVISHLPEFKGRQKKYFDHKSSITIKDLLTHTSGLPPFRQYYLMKGSIDTRLDSIYNTEPVFDLHETMVYSDVGIIILGKIVETISKVKLDAFVQSNIFDPLGMNNTFYNPPKEKLHRMVPTEIDPKGNLIKGYVHDENAHSIGGVAGHAGLFSKTKDLAIFSQMMLNKGLYGWKRIFKSETVDLFTQRSNIIKGDSRCLGWDSPSGMASGGVYLSNASYGHTGFTGTSLWIDPENDMIVILLTNAVHPDRESKTPHYFDWRQRIHSAVYESVGLTEKNPDLQWRREW